MEAVILVGIQGSGKTSFYRERLAGTHAHVSLDVLRTRARERAALEACLAAGRPFAVDNTNATRAERRRYVEPARAAGFRVVACFFDTPPRQAIALNAAREGRARIPVAGVLGTQKRLEPPRVDEGFHAVHVVVLDPERGRFDTRAVSNVGPR